jgi:hypothetical protein
LQKIINYTVDKLLQKESKSQNLHCKTKNRTKIRSRVTVWDLKKHLAFAVIYVNERPIVNL